MILKVVVNPTFYPVKIFFRNEGEIKTFSSEGKLREFIAIKGTLKRWLKEVLKTERNW